jgi:hypothetical protein
VLLAAGGQLPAGCELDAFAARIKAFLDAFNHGDGEAIDGFFPDEIAPAGADQPGFQWFTLVDENGAFATTDPAAMADYVSFRHARNERLTLLSFDVLASWRADSAGGTYLIRREADDLPGGTLVGGKGELRCSTGEIEVWTSSSEGLPPPATAPALPADATCPVTPPRDIPPPPEVVGDAELDAAAFWHGNHALWGVLPRDGTLEVEEGADGLGTTFGWWRAIPGELSIEGRRLDAPAPPLLAEIPDDDGDDAFLATGLVFPTAGCWEVWGRIDNQALRFVVLVEPRTENSSAASGSQSAGG